MKIHLEAAAANPLVPNIAEIVVGLIAFSLLYIVLRSRVVPMFEKAFSARTAAIEGGIAKAESAQREAQEALRAYTAQLSDARGEAQAIREEARVQGAAILEDLRAKAQEEAARITTAALASIEVGTLATELASKIVGEALEDQVRQSGIVDRFLADLEQSKK
jgi:F-type H+-transporting ATPase subunit b